MVIREYNHSNTLKLSSEVLRENLCVSQNDKKNEKKTQKDRNT